jgi:hypothetical protein
MGVSLAWTWGQDSSSKEQFKENLEKSRRRVGGEGGGKNEGDLRWWKKEKH